MNLKQLYYPAGVKQVFSTEVLVVGGGVAGICAATACARNGAETLLIETNGFLGGNGAAGLSFAAFHDGRKQIIRGLAEEFAERIRALGGLSGRLDRDRWIPVDGECLKLAADEMVIRSGSRLLLHTQAAEPLRKDANIVAVSVETKSGRLDISTRMVIDCSGDADIAFRSGVPCKTGRNSDGKTQSMTLIFTVAGVDWEPFEAGGGYAELVRRFDIIAAENHFENPRRNGLSGMFAVPGRPGQVAFNVTRVLHLQATDPAEWTRAELAGRRQAREFVYEFLIPHVPGFQRASLAAVGHGIGIRETRRIVGEYVVTEEDICQYRKHECSIGCGSYPVDVHSPDGSTTDYRRHEHIPGQYYTLPYPMLIPQGVNNLLVAGRCVSATHEALSALRVMPNCMVMGQAAGTAAALCVRRNITPRELEITSLQQKLLAEGAYLGEPTSRRKPIACGPILTNVPVT
ncbi:MAG: FAD-dependent oxidoreductase [Phycisphaerae bacterium]|nr:FAD-dependent oxidoreductase [Phycisphaerae bacterium]